jgi:hypothetical protein
MLHRCSSRALAGRKLKLVTLHFLGLIMSYDISRGADSESGKSFLPQSVVDQYTEDRKDAIYFDEEKLLNFISESHNSAEFALRVMASFFEYRKNNESVADLGIVLTEHCQWFRNDMTEDLAAL